MRFSGCCATALFKCPASPDIAARHTERIDKLLANRMDSTLSPSERRMERALT
jgi:hypothetical protein